MTSTGAAARGNRVTPGATDSQGSYKPMAALVTVPGAGEQIPGKAEV